MLIGTNCPANSGHFADKKIRFRDPTESIPLCRRSEDHDDGVNLRDILNIPPPV